ncbi:GxxExxY protein [Sediminispirochaeta bajacaliforniensis]|uniref:GxxExxY protein n=1 Tax=Sediminispirochaeta bajacaliforniensis TaxID=148 RepID=UPI0009DA4457
MELEAQGLVCERQKGVAVSYRGISVGSFRADLVIEDRILVELKAVGQVTSGMESQLFNYLKLSHLPVGYLLNFNAPSLFFKRLVNTKRHAP